MADDEVYILTAIAAGFDELGFADHTPWPYQTGYRSDMRMDLPLLEDYIANLTRLREMYANRIRLHIGLECEYYEPYIPWLTEVAAKNGLYLILGTHYSQSEENGELIHMGGGCETPELRAEYCQASLKGINSGIFTYFAHPDLFLRNLPAFPEDGAFITKELCRACNVMDLPLEMNLASLRLAQKKEGGYQEWFLNFWRIAAEMKSRAIIGYDAHNPNTLRDEEGAAAAEALLTELGMERLDQLPL